MQGAAPVPRRGPPPRGLPLGLPDHGSVCGTDRWQLPEGRHPLPAASAPQGLASTRWSWKKA